jgi:thioredoxin 1
MKKSRYVCQKHNSSAMKKLVLVFLLLLTGTIYSNTLLAGNGEDGAVVKLTKDEFLKKVMDYEKNPNEWKYLGSLPCVIDFYADWCGPCRQASPILEELAQKYKGKIVVYKINTDQEKELARAFGIRGIPAFLWVPQSGKPTMSSGVAHSAEETKQMFEKMIGDVLLKK